MRYRGTYMQTQIHAGTQAQQKLHVLMEKHSDWSAETTSEKFKHLLSCTSAAKKLKKRAWTYRSAPLKRSLVTSNEHIHNIKLFSTKRRQNFSLHVKSFPNPQFTAATTNLSPKPKKRTAKIHGIKAPQTDQVSPQPQTKTRRNKSSPAAPSPDSLAPSLGLGLPSASSPLMAPGREPLTPERPTPTDDGTDQQDHKDGARITSLGSESRVRVPGEVRSGREQTLVGQERTGI